METVQHENCFASERRKSLALGALLGMGCAALMAISVGVAYRVGLNQGTSQGSILIEGLHASATHGGSNMAVATGPIDEDSEGIYFLDFITGDLQCWVYYPRTNVFGAKFSTNVTAQLPGGKNAEYLLVTGATIPSQASSNARPSRSLAYVVDVRSGTFAAYGFPWNESAEKSGQPQQGFMVAIAGGQIRTPNAAAK